MRSWLDANIFTTAAAVLTLSFSLGACDSQSIGTTRTSEASRSAPPTQVAVGPLPGIAPPPMAPPATNPYGEDPTAAMDGRRLFVAFNCYGCHGGRAGGGMAPSLRDPDWLYGDSDAHVFDSIAAGRGRGMPAWGSRLPEREIWKLVSYIHSLGTDHEPQAPH
jgi:cytochrome c oxidase cbb3-type subunit 3